MKKETGRFRCCNTAVCFVHSGFFTIKLDVNSGMLVPRCKGLSRIGNLIRVPFGEIKKTLLPEFFITVAGGVQFKIPADAVLEVRDENGEVICFRTAVSFS